MRARRLAAVLLALSLPVVGCSEEATANLPDVPVVDTPLADIAAPDDAPDASPLDTPDVTTAPDSPATPS